jgi:hypothetical protein
LTRCCLRLRFCSNEGNEIVVPPITPIAPYPITPQNKILLLHYVPRDGDGAPGSIGQTVTDVAPYPLCTTATATAALLFVIISITSRMMRIQFLVPPQRLVINTGLWFACRKYCFIFATDGSNVLLMCNGLPRPLVMAAMQTSGCVSRICCRVLMALSNKYSSAAAWRSSNHALNKSSAVPELVVPPR